MDHEVLACVQCAVRKFACDRTRPICKLCQSSSPETQCSYEWVVGNPHIYDLFPKDLNFNSDRVLPFSWDRAPGNYAGIFRGTLKEGGCVAIKLLFGDGPTKDAALLLCLKHAWTWSPLKHANIAVLLGVANFREIMRGGSPQLSFISPWFDEGNIMQYTAGHPNADVFPLLVDTVEGLRYLHRQTSPIIHANLRGSNVLIELREGKPTAAISDIGVSRALQAYNEEYAQSWARQLPVGNPRWIAFERASPWEYGMETFADAETVSSDVFELLRTFLEVLSGRHPFYYEEYDRNVERMFVSKGQNPERPSEASPRLDDAMWGLMESGWSHDIAKRPTLSQIQDFLQDGIAHWNRRNDGSETVSVQEPVATHGDNAGANDARNDSLVSVAHIAEDPETEETTKAT